MSIASFDSRAALRLLALVSSFLFSSFAPWARAAAQPPHTFAGPNGMLVFQSTRGGSAYENLYVGYADGLGARRLTNVAADDLDPAFSPNGRQVLFLRQTEVNDVYTDELYIIDTDGTGLHAITNDGLSKYNFVWSSDGTRVAYVDENHDIWVVRADGTNRVRIAQASEAAKLIHDTPIWSPDSSRIAFATLDFSESSPEHPFGKGNIFTVGPDGTGLSAVTSLPLDSFTSTPRFSADGTRIAYLRSNTAIVGGTLTIRSEISVASPTGTVSLTPDPQVYDEKILDWSTASDRILFERSHHETHVTTVWTMLSNGTGRLMVGNGIASDAAFSPNGQRILYRAYSSGSTGADQFVSVTLSGSDLRVVNARPDHAASWGTLFGDVSGKDVVRIEVHEPLLDYVLEGPLESGNVERTTSAFPIPQQRIQGTGTLRTPRNTLATISFDLTHVSISGAPWQGSFTVSEPQVINVTYGIGGATVDFPTGSGSRSWTTWKQICGPLTCFQIPVFHAFAFRVDDRS